MSLYKPFIRGNKKPRFKTFLHRVDWKFQPKPFHYTMAGYDTLPGRGVVTLPRCAFLNMIKRRCPNSGNPIGNPAISKEDVKQALEKYRYRIIKF